MATIVEIHRILAVILMIILVAILRIQTRNPAALRVAIVKMVKPMMMSWRHACLINADEALRNYDCWISRA